LYGRVRHLLGCLERGGDRGRDAAPCGQEANQNIRASWARLKNWRKRVQDGIGNSRGGRHIVQRISRESRVSQ
jgi:hypothetical protein